MTMRCVGQSVNVPYVYVRVLWRLQCSHPTTQRPTTAYQPHPAEPAQHTTCSNIRLVLLKMGIMMPETCWDSVDNKHLIVAFCWFSLYLHNWLTIHGHRNLKTTTFALLSQLLEAESCEGPSCHSCGQHVLFLIFIFILFFFSTHRFVCVRAVECELQLWSERLARRDLKTQNTLTRNCRNIWILLRFKARLFLKGLFQNVSATLQKTLILLKYS